MYMTNFNDITYDMYENLDELYENLDHFRETYYSEATLQTHIDYVYKIFRFRKNNDGRYPTKKEFYCMFRNNCFCSFYIDDDDMYTLASDFFMSKTGEITNITCANVYYFCEFYTLERRSPESIREFNIYASQSIISLMSPDFFNTEMPSRPVHKSKIDQLRDRIFTFTYNFKGDCDTDIKEYCSSSFSEGKYEEKESVGDHFSVEKKVCSVCQDDIEDNQKVIRLDCGHYFHSDINSCCENGNIFDWFKNHNSCPLCRKEV